MKKILVIDDEIAIRDLIELVLKRENYQVKTAENGAIGLMEINSFHPDLVLLDLMLPDYSGYDLCREIVKKSTIPVIMLVATGRFTAFLNSAITSLPEYPASGPQGSSM